MVVGNPSESKARGCHYRVQAALHRALIEARESLGLLPEDVPFETPIRNVADTHTGVCKPVSTGKFGEDSFDDQGRDAWQRRNQRNIIASLKADGETGSEASLTVLEMWW